MHLLYILFTVMEIFNPILLVSFLMIATTIQILFIKYKQSLLITLKKTFQLWIRSSISMMAVLNNWRIAETLLVCIIISKIWIWMLNGYFLQLVMASHQAIVLGDLWNVIYKRPLHDQIFSYESMLDLCVREIPSFTIFWYKSGRNGQCLCWPGGSLCKVKDCVYNKSGFHFVPISFNKIAHKLTNEDREFLQFDFDKLLTEEIIVFTIDFGGLT